MKLIIPVIILLIIAIVNTEDYQQEAADIEHYCEMVEGGYWGEYRSEVKCD